MNNLNEKKLKILIIGGTSESIAILKFLKCKKEFKDKLFILTTTTTNHGKEIAIENGADIAISRSQSNESLIDFINSYSIDLIIDASHPFAVNATISGINASKETNTKYIRYEREELDLNKLNLKHPENIHKVSSFSQAGKIIRENIEKNKENKEKNQKTNSKNDIRKNILHLGGISTTQEVLKYVKKENLFIRILPQIYSIKKSIELGINSKNIIAIEGTFSKEFNKSIMKEYNIGAILTKESGIEGGMCEKLLAADELKIDSFLIMKPTVDLLIDEVVVNSLNELKEEIYQLKDFFIT
ncbi:MAG: precorrin-6A reductase [Methanobrevibacter sp.]|jgi:precorrin-6A/cobalt-precorrin-6A reductase|nr:precorrin-6A reductase [Candidatus Methanoflexus mossambicus]